MEHSSFDGGGDSNRSGGMVFLVWECASSGLAVASDTFLFDAQNKIRTQTVVSVPSAKSLSASPTAKFSSSLSLAAERAQVTLAGRRRAAERGDFASASSYYREGAKLVYYNLEKGYEYVFRGRSGVSDVRSERRCVRIVVVFAYHHHLC